MSYEKKYVLVCDSMLDFFYDELAALEGVELLETAKDLDSKKNQLLEQADVAIVRSATKITKDIIDQSKNLKLIVRAGMGINNIDIDAAKEKGIAVANTPGENANAAAEHALALILSCMRQIPQAMASLKQGLWQRKKFMGYEIKGKTLGLLGLGHVGKFLAQKAHALGMKVIYYDPFVENFNINAHETMASLDAISVVLERSDLISLHMPHTQKTENIVNADFLNKMQKHAHLINTARGELIDEQALIQALESQTIAGAALDVFAQEPLEKNHPFLSLSNLIVSPHLGASSFEAQDNVAHAVIKAIKSYVQKGEVLHRIV